ncbi:MAG: DUF2491 family protein [Pseudomonadota bacterium]
MIGRFFRRDSEPEPPKEHGPLKLILGGAVEIDTLGIQASLAGGEPAMEAPAGGSFVVAAIGTAKLDGGVVLTRYYDDEHRILQVLAPPGAGAEGVEDVSLYVPWDSVAPMNDAEWQRWTGPTGMIGEAEYDADGILFRRYWGDGPGRVDLVEFTEDVDDGEQTRAIHQRCMLYSRPVGSAEEMLLITIERDIHERASREGGSVEFLIGYGLSPADIRRV